LLDEKDADAMAQTLEILAEQAAAA
jgi:hypothetical protein